MSVILQCDKHNRLNPSVITTHTHTDTHLVVRLHDSDVSPFFPFVPVTRLCIKMMDEESTKRYVRDGEESLQKKLVQRGSKVQSSEEEREIAVLPHRRTSDDLNDTNEMGASHSSSCCSSCISLKDKCPRPRGLFSLVITKVCLFALLFGVVWSITGSMLLAGLLLRNVPYITDAIFIDTHWSAALRNIALSIILTRAGLGLDPSALRRLKAVCVRVAVGPCTVEACVVAVVSHFLLGLPWVWGFILGFVLAAVSPAVVVPSMLLLQKEGYGVEKGIPTLLMAAGSFDDVLAITGFSTCLGIAFSTGSTWMNILKGLLEVVGGIIAGLILGLFLCLFPSKDQEDLVLKRTLMLLGLAIFSVFFSHVVGFAGAGGLSTLVLAFLAALGWKTDKAPVAAMVGRSWDVFQPLLFGLIGAEITIAALSPNTVGLGLACIFIGLVIRLIVTFVLVHFGGFNLKEKLFIAVAWLPKATVQAAIGSKALDMAREVGDETMIKFGLDVLTLAVLAILTTAPIGALGIGLAGPRLLEQQVKDETEGEATTSTCNGVVQEKDYGTLESKL
ncbi:sodium/hydrogen exchanger 9B2 isoform X2 [Cynoglossus semilaevis]|uniref:sodium/hydrogen exchanger 9B2 isoform X2 n=1 Tax=Cynoglossus semilaevis TaxID=244447 RepID=UPI000D6305EF|nr:sodium/hydrogen exchanger 9B2-like isoform X2 [Cynoglossus semilaevis]